MSVSTAPATNDELPAFLAGGGECARLVAEREWSNSLGPVNRWPTSLKTATALLLRSAIPMVMLWGADGIMIYNDGYALIAGGKHPHLLGSKVLEGWAEVADFNHNVMQVGLAGGSLAYRDQELTLYRNGAPEQVFMDLDYSPVVDDEGAIAGVLAVVIETTARVAAERAHRASERRLREILDTMGESLAVLDREFRFIDLNAEALRMEQRGRDELIGLTHWEAHPGAHPALGDLLKSAMADRQSHSMEHRYRWADGRDSWIEVRANPIDAGLAVFYRDITGHVEQQRALRESEERLRLAVNAAEIGLWDVDPIADRLYWPEQVKKMFGIHSDRAVSMADFYNGLHPDDRDSAGAAFAAALDPDQRALYDVEYRTIGLEDGLLRWVAAKGRGIFDEAGRCVRVIGTAIDVSPRKTAELHQRLLIDELSHRTKNLLAIIQGLAHQSFRGSASPAQMKRIFEGRLGALAAAHNVITRQRWERAPMRAVLTDTIAAVLPSNERVELTGPDLLIPPKTAVSLAIAVHELATNALKYGSLLEPDGRVALRWEERDGRLRLRWEESGGPLVRAPSQRGFGTRMIERGLASELGGEVRIDFRPSGVVCTVDAPLPAVEP